MTAPHATETTPHDWASPEYVRFWAERTDREEAERRHRFDLMADLVPYPDDAPLAILDIGAGYGALTAVMLERFPKARATCVDGSAAMLALLETRQAQFLPRLSLVIADYSRPAWAERLSGARFDVVVSSQALHGQRERRRALYREIYGLVRPDGCFFSADLVSPSTESLHERFREVQIRRWLRREESRTGRPPAYDEAVAHVDGLRPGAIPASRPYSAWAAADWTEDLAWLREAGFVDVDCFWKELRLALIGGYRGDGHDQR